MYNKVEVCDKLIKKQLNNIIVNALKNSVKHIRA